ncbi:MAG: cation transporter [Defluviitaleaceae bacterium]|nr:cation transporter [Defluviitaleaceae bacterium]
MENIRLTVTGMHCKSCKFNVEGALEDIGCAEVAASPSDNLVEVTFDPSAVSLDQIKAEIKELGFEVQ